MIVPGSDVATAAGFGGKPPARAMRVTFRPWENEGKTVLGFVRLELPSGIVVNKCKLMIGPRGRRWLALPSERQRYTDASLRLVDDKPVWEPTVEIPDKEVRERFQEQALAALGRQYPEAFAGDEP
jgi:hypothetical protein